MGRCEGSRTLPQVPKPTVLFPAESIIHSDPVFNLKDNYFMSQNERYEASIQKKFHIQKIAERLGWLEDSPELHYASRCLFPGQPHQRGSHLGSPRTPSPMSYFP